MIAKKFLFSDIDGTLLHKFTYQPDASLGAVNRLKEHGVEMILCSSKTFQEQLYYTRIFNLSSPFIFENGSAIAVPESYPSSFSFQTPPEEGYYILPLVEEGFHIRQAVTEVLKEFGDKLHALSQSSNEFLKNHIRLSDAMLNLAKQKRYTETFISESATSPDIVQLMQIADKHQAKMERGSRFLNLMSKGVSKGKAMQFLVREILKPSEENIWAIGDGENDISMLDNAHQGVFLSQSVEQALPKYRNFHPAGPDGFAKAADWIIDTFC